MSTTGRPMGEMELDNALRSWMRDGAVVDAPRLAERAMTQVATTHQDRRPFARGWSSTRARAGWATAVAAALVIAVGLYLGLSTIGPAHPSSPPSSTPATPSPSPSATPAPTGFVTVGSEDEGYEVQVPAAWPEVDLGFDDAHRWADDERAVTVSYGTSIFEGGNVTMCGPPGPDFAPCRAQAFPYSIPYDPEVDGVAPLSIEGFVRDACAGGCDVTVTETTLGGEPAYMSQTVAADLRATFVSTFHDRRPVIVYWSQLASVSGNGVVERIRRSFQFLDPAPVVSPSPFLDPTELVPFVDAEIGYELLVPRFWGVGEAYPACPGVHEFGSGRGHATRSDPALTIMVGAVGGASTLGPNVLKFCPALGATTLDELDGFLVGVSPQFPLQNQHEVVGDLVLAGEAGRFKRPAYEQEPPTPTDFGIGGDIFGNCLGCPGLAYHAYTVKDGRPVVITIDWWTIAFEELPPEYIGDILRSFRFLE